MQKLIQSIGRVSPYFAGNLAANVFITPLNQPKITRGQAMLDEAQAVDMPIDGQSLRVYVWGNGAQTVVLCHGWRACAGSMSAFVDPLLAAGFRVVAFDAPAHRDSSGRQVTLDSYGAAIRQVVARFSPVHAVIAHSFGAFSLVLQMQGERALSINQAVLIGCPKDHTNVIERFATQMQLSAAVKQVFEQTMRAKFQHDSEYYSAVKALSETNITGLLVHDADDNIMPFHNANTLAQYWQGVTRLTTHGLGHNDILRDPDTVARIVEFVSRKTSSVQG